MQFVPILEASLEIQQFVRHLRNQRDVRKYMYTSHEISEAEHNVWITSLIGNTHQLVFVILKEGIAVGVVSLNSINPEQKTADWAFYLDAAYQGKGVGSLIEFWLLDHAFTAMGLEKLNCEVLETNPSVIKMHQKFGFVIEGVRRKNVIKEGVRIDVVMLGITKDEWASQRLNMLPTLERISR